MFRLPADFNHPDLHPRRHEKLLYVIVQNSGQPLALLQFRLRKIHGKCAKLVGQPLNLIRFFPERKFIPDLFGDVKAYFHDEGFAVHILEGEIVDVVISAVGARPLPAVSVIGLQHLVGFTIAARLGTVEKILEAAGAAGFSEPFLEETVGEGNW